MNLPAGASDVSLWDGLHDAQIVSIQSNLLERTVILTCEIEHLREFYELPLDLRFVLRFEGVQSARALRYAIWPGEFSIPAGVSREEESRLITEYQAKWRQESLGWDELEKAVTTECAQVIDISNAMLATAEDHSIAVRICGHLNYVAYHELYLRAERLVVSKSDGENLGIQGLLKMGAAYWEAFERRAKADAPKDSPSDAGEE